MTAARWQSPADPAVVARLRAEVAAGLAEERRRRAEANTPLAPADERQYGRALVRRALDARRTAGPAPSAEDERALADAVYAALFTVGHRLQPLLDDPDVTNIEVNGHDKVLVYLRDGRVLDGPAVADSNDELIEMVRTVTTYSGLSSRPFDPAHPAVEDRLPDGSRLCALMSNAVRPVVSIRCYRNELVRLDGLHRDGWLNAEVRDFLRAAVLSRMNLVISGEKFAGKTTLCRGLGHEIPYEERIITAEHFRELGYSAFPDLHRDVVELEERPPNAEGAGGVDLQTLVRQARRIYSDRIIVGEVMDTEVVAMLDAATSGSDGSMTTIHARSAAMVFDRIIEYGQRVGRPPSSTMRLIAGGVDFVIHMAKATGPDGRVNRYVASIREVVGSDGVQVISNEVYTGTPAGQHRAAPITLDRSLRLAAAGYHPQSNGGLR